MNLIDNFLFQYFTNCKNQILKGVNDRKYLFDKKYGFPGCLECHSERTDSLKIEKNRMIDSLQKWDVNLSDDHPIDDSVIFTCIKTFLLICESAESEESKSRIKYYSGITQSISGLLKIVCLNNPAYLSYEKYVYHITQSENVVKFILSLFELDNDEKIFAFGGDKYSYNKFEDIFNVARGLFVSRQYLTGHLSESPAITSLLWCMRNHRNCFSHNSASDSLSTERSSDLHTYIIDRNESLKRLRYLLIDYITIFFFLQKKLPLLSNFEKIKEKVANETVSFEIYIKDDTRDNTLKLNSTDGTNVRLDKVDDKYEAKIFRFQNYQLNINKIGFTDSIQFRIDHTYTPDVRLIISIPPGKYEPSKPEIKDLIDIDYIPELKMMEEIWDECKFEKDVTEFIKIVKELTLKSFIVNKENNEDIKALKESITDSIFSMHKKIKTEANACLSDIFAETEIEISAIHDRMKEAIDNKRLKEACILIDQAFAKLGYLKTTGSKNGLTRMEQISEASRNFMDNKILDLSNTDNDNFIQDVNDLTLLNAILEVGDLNMLELLKDRLESISSERENNCKLAFDFYNAINDGMMSFHNEDISSDRIIVSQLALDFVKRITMLWSSENLASFLYLHGNYIESVLSLSNVDIRKIHDEIISGILPTFNKNDFKDSLNKNTIDSINDGLFYLRRMLLSLKPLPIIAKIADSKQSSPSSGLITPFCESLIEYEQKRNVITGFLCDYIGRISDNLSEFDIYIIGILWDYLLVYYNILSGRLITELDMMNIDRNRYYQDMAEWDNSISNIKDCYMKLHEELSDVLNHYQNESSVFNSALLKKINHAFEEKLKDFYKVFCPEILNDVINAFSQSDSGLSKMKLYQELYDIRYLYVPAIPLALKWRIADKRLPVSWNSFNKFRNILHKHKSTFLDPKLFVLLPEQTKNTYISTLISFFRNPHERLRIMDLYENYVENKDIKNFLMSITTAISNTKFYPERSSEIKDSLTLLHRINNMKGEIHDQALDAKINDFKNSIKSNVSKLLETKIKINKIHEGNFSEFLGAKIISTKGSLEKLIPIWESLGAHNMGISNYIDKENEIFGNILSELNSIYENGDTAKAKEYSLKILSRLTIHTIYSSANRVSRFNQLKRFITDDSIPSVLKKWMEYQTGEIYLNDYNDLQPTLSGLENIFRNYNEKMELPSHYESAYSFAEAITLCVDIERNNEF